MGLRARDIRLRVHRGLCGHPGSADKSLQVSVILGVVQMRQHSGDRRLDVTDESKVDAGSASQVFSAFVDLNDGRLFGIELRVRKVGAKHEERFRFLDGVIARGEADQSRQSHVVGIIVLDVLASAQGRDDGGLKLAGQRHQFGMSTGTARAAKNRRALRRIEELGQLSDFLF